MNFKPGDVPKTAMIDGVEYPLYITGADEPISFGYYDETGFHQYVCRPDGEILNERHFPPLKDSENG